MEKIIMRSWLIPLCFFCIALPYFVQGQSETIQTLKDDQKVRTGYFLLPSTMRMINLQKDPEFDKLIRPIRKISVLSMHPDKFSREDLRKSARQIIAEEGYESYAEVDGPDNTIFVLGKPKMEHTCVLAFTDEQYFISEIQGSIDIMQLTKLYEKMSSDTSARDSTGNAFSGNFVDIFSLLKEDDDLKDRREKREKERVEKKEKNAAKNNNLKGVEVSDSIVIKKES